jgi:hypothetical protein
MKQEAHKETKGKLSQCPHCGSDYGVYERIKYSGIGYYFRDFKGEPTSANSGFYDSANWTVFKTKYCGQCHKKLNSKNLALPFSED